jgi:broad specificity phosphatase PhoE
VGAAKTGAGAQGAGWRQGWSIRYIAEMTRVILACHAQPEKSTEVPRADWALSQLGREQAAHVAGRLAEFAPLNIVSGPSRRTKETAEVVSKRLGKAVKVDARVGEITAPQGVADRQEWLDRVFRTQNGVLWSQLDPATNKWRNDNIQAIRELRENTVVFTHYANINVIMGAALQVDLTAVCQPNHISLTEFSVVNGDIRLVIEGTEIKGPNE